MTFGVSAILLALAVILFIVAAVSTDPTDWWSLGLAAFAAAFLVSELGWDRTFTTSAPRRDSS
jgi:hypothetical protein